MRIERGIRRKGNGIEAYATVRGRIISKRFDLSTPLEIVRKWRAAAVDPEQCLLLPTLTSPPVLEVGGYVYFIQCRQFVKVGKARNIAQRIEELQTAHPEPLRLVAYIPTRQPSRVEADILNEYRECCARGEWLNITPDVERLIRHHANKNMAPQMAPDVTNREHGS